MFEFLRDHRHIVVTGPHRSGTTICAAMIAHDMGHELVLEERFEWRRDDLFRPFLEAGANVIQAPAMFHRIPQYGPLREVAVVLMRRPLAELAESRARMWHPDGERLSADEQNKFELAALGEAAGDAAAFKYERWRTWRPMIRHPYEVAYAELAAHPMWVAARVRRAEGKGWTHRRIA